MPPWGGSNDSRHRAAHHVAGRRPLASARTRVSNGPVGAFEIAPFQTGTMTIAKVAAQLTKAGALETIAGGGDTIAALNQARCNPGLYLCLDRQRRFSGMARGQAIARRRGAP